MVRKENKIALYLDDQRTPTEDIPNHTWVIVRSYKEFTDYITELYRNERVLPNHISFDHDLGKEHTDFYFEHKGEQIPYGDFKEKTGMHCAKWLTDLCDKNEIDARYVYMSVHSHNPIGAKNIQEWLNFWKMSKYGPEYAHTFTKKFNFEIKQNES